MSLSLPKSFIHFGCWGEPERHPKGKSELFKYIKKRNVDFYTVAGDNYYPKKPEKEKKPDKPIVIKDSDIKRANKL